MKLKLEPPSACVVSRSTFARALSHVLLPAAAVVFAADAPAEPQRVLDLESYLRVAQRERLERILQTLEADTGYKLRVATQSRATAPGLKSLRAQWAADDRTVIVIADAGRVAQREHVVWLVVVLLDRMCRRQAVHQRPHPVHDVAVAARCRCEGRSEKGRGRAHLWNGCPP